MAVFTLDAGEDEVHREPVTLVVDRKAQPATLVLTDRRLVVTVSSKPSALGVLFGAVGALLARFLDSEELRVAYQIDRDRFASVERGENKLLVFRDDAEGYACTSFAIMTKTTFEAWQDLLHQWRAGLSDVAPLPPARIVDD